jgi:hypothetical protein
MNNASLDWKHNKTLKENNHFGYKTRVGELEVVLNLCGLRVLLQIFGENKFI